MDKDFCHVRRIGFLLGIFKDNPDQESTKQAKKIIGQYIIEMQYPGLILAQANKIDAILII